MVDTEISHEDLATAARVMRLMNERVIARMQSEQGAEWGVEPRGTLDPDRRAAPCDRRAEDRVTPDRRAA
jgi:hypothetical protein